MYTLFIILILLASFFMIAIVLIQESKGGGLASNFSSSNSIMGVRKTTDVVEKTTWILAVSMVVLSVICAYVAPKAATEESAVEKMSTEAPATNPNTTPGFGATSTPTTIQPVMTTNKTSPATGDVAPQATQQAPKTPAK